jgi:hypothetical protein
MALESKSKVDELEILRKFSEYSEIISRFFKGHSLEDREVGEFVGAKYLTTLNDMKVTKLSKFSALEWDYNNDEMNAPANVQGAKLKLNFAIFKNVPYFIIIEVKCLMHIIYLSPKEFSRGKRTKSTVKANSLISKFKGGLRFLDFLFEKLNQDGKEYVQSCYRSLGDIIQSDLVDAALEFEYSYNEEMKSFFYYLKHVNTNKILGYQITVDFEALDWKLIGKRNKGAKIIFDNESLWKQVSYASNSITQFLLNIGEIPRDESSIKLLNATEQNQLHISKSLLDAYTILRLYSKGHTQGYIESICDIPSFLKNRNGNLFSLRTVRKNILTHHSEIAEFNDIRIKLNVVYYSACYIIGQFTGMRPSALAEITLNACLVSEDGIQLLIADDKKGQTHNLGLFDDKWVAIPIMEDAVKAASIIAKSRNRKYLYSSADTLRPEGLEKKMASNSIAELTASLVKVATGKSIEKVKPYVMRDTLAYQLFRADLGLPYISFHLKHFVNQVDNYRSMGATSDVTLSYGDIGTHLTGKNGGRQLQNMAEVEVVENLMDPDGTYLGKKGKEHSYRVKKAFEGYMASGYTKEEVFEAMAKQGVAIINMGTGFCYGGVEDFDESLPCIGGLRCNPVRCKNAIVTKLNKPKWREVYIANKALIGKTGYEDRQEQILEAVKEAEAVLLDLGEEVLV